MTVLRERVAWSRPRARRGPDLSPEEASHVRAAIAFLAVRLGGWQALAEAAGVKLATLRYAAKARGGVSAGGQRQGAQDGQRRRDPEPRTTPRAPAASHVGAANEPKRCHKTLHRRLPRLAERRHA